MATVVITGGTGLIGTALTKELVKKNFDVIILTRNLDKHKASKNISYAKWDIEAKTINENIITKADYIIHLAGANVAEGRWTNKRKNEIIYSRVKSGELLVKALKEIPNKVKAVISSSAIGYYGADQTTNTKPFIETDAAASDFLSTVVQKWEGAIEAVKNTGKRLVVFRTGIVLSADGGAYKEFKKPLQFGIASILGNGKQIISWIHIDDLVRMYVQTIENEAWQGVYNAVAPKPVSNKVLILEMAKQHNKFYVPLYVPSFVLKIMLGEMRIEVLKSTTVSCAKVQSAGFVFLFSSVEAAIRKLVAS